MPRRAAPRRIRRTAEDARSEILDAAERRLREAGPAGIRLQEVAADVGVGHTTVLHHFGSREALVDAVVTRAFDRLHDDLLASIGRGEHGEPSIARMLDRVAEVLGPGGHGRVVAWLALSGMGRAHDPGVRTVAKAAHALREARRGADGAPPFEDTYFTVLLAALALFGDAVVGPLLRGEAGGTAEGAEPSRAERRFRAWLAKLLAEHLEKGGC